DVLARIAIANTRRRSREDVLQRAMAAASRQHRRRESEERVALRTCVVRTARNQSARQRNVLQARAAAKRQVGGVVINGDDRVGGHLLAALEEPPPRRPRFATVIFKQLAGEPAERARFLAFYQSPTQHRAFSILWLVVLRLAGARFGPRQVRRMPLDEPVAE